MHIIRACVPICEERERWWQQCQNMFITLHLQDLLLSNHGNIF